MSLRVVVTGGPHVGATGWLVEALPGQPCLVELDLPAGWRVLVESDHVMDEQAYAELVAEFGDQGDVGDVEQDGAGGGGL